MLTAVIEDEERRDIVTYGILNAFIKTKLNLAEDGTRAMVKTLSNPDRA